MSVAVNILILIMLLRIYRRLRIMKRVAARKLATYHYIRKG
jgi:hypothetical protein